MHALLDTQKYKRAVARPRSQRATLDCCPIYTHANPRVCRDRACPFSSDAVCPVGFMHAALAAAPTAAAPATYSARAAQLTRRTRPRSPSPRWLSKDHGYPLVNLGPEIWALLLG